MTTTEASSHRKQTSAAAPLLLITEAVLHLISAGHRQGISEVAHPTTFAVPPYHHPQVITGAVLPVTTEVARHFLTLAALRSIRMLVMQEGTCLE